MRAAGGFIRPCEYGRLPPGGAARGGFADPWHVRRRPASVSRACIFVRIDFPFLIIICDIRVTACPCHQVARKRTATSNGDTHASTGHDPYAALRDGQYRRFLSGGVLSVVGGQMLNVAVGWELYERTHDALALGLVGLAQVAPVLLLSLPAGHLADRYDRRLICVLAQTLRACSTSFMLWISLTHAPVEAVYACLFANGVSRACHAPARTALMPQLLKPGLFESAVRWNTSGFQLASTCGPALGGLVMHWAGAAWPVYAVDLATTLINAGCIGSLRKPEGELKREPLSMERLLGGLRFIWSAKVILAAITLDLFAVLLGGVTALLPIYAQDVLQAGPQGLGWLRAADSAGALAMALTMAHRPPIRRAGRTLLWSVAGFGLGIVVFGLSTNLWLSMLALAACGACDNISVIVRHTLIQLRTPNEMRGRVASVNSIFIASSNELGMLESGTVASLFGHVAAAVSGGVGTLLVVLFAALRWPELRKLGAIHEEHDRRTVNSEQ
ncbi:MAG: MFS transporter [Planctomycetota bacterium]|nr:MFS transporter [Planctomycetota bacterium]